MPEGRRAKRRTGEEEQQENNSMLKNNRCHNSNKKNDIEKNRSEDHRRKNRKRKDASRKKKKHQEKKTFERGPKGKEQKDKNQKEYEQHLEDHQDEEEKEEEQQEVELRDEEIREDQQRRKNSRKTKNSGRRRSSTDRFFVNGAQQFGNCKVLFAILWTEIVAQLQGGLIAIVSATVLGIFKCKTLRSQLCDRRNEISKCTIKTEQDSAFFQTAQSQTLPSVISLRQCVQSLHLITKTQHTGPDPAFSMQRQTLSSPDSPEIGSADILYIFSPRQHRI